MSVKESAKEGGGGCLVFIILLGLIAIYASLDNALFARLRPWNLFLAVAQLAIGITGLMCYVVVLVRLLQSKEKALGVVCAVLTPCLGLGPLLAYAWGWLEATRLERTSQQERDKHTFLMKVWTGALIGQLAVLAYVWYHTPAQPARQGMRGVVSPAVSPPVFAPTPPVQPLQQRTCYRCNGSGRENCHICFGNPGLRRGGHCHGCAGHGSNTCSVCWGSGKVR